MYILYISWVKKCTVKNVYIQTYTVKRVAAARTLHGNL